MKALQISHKTIYFFISLIIILTALININLVYANNETTTINEFSIGASGENVKELQKLLNEYGYVIAIDGNFGKETENAVVAFQKDCQLPENGIVDNETWNQLHLCIINKESSEETTEQIVTESVEETSDFGREFIIWMIIGILFICFICFLDFCNKHGGISSWLANKLHPSEITYIKASDFLKYWNSYRNLDQPGCYVFLIFDSPVQNSNFSKYQNVYVGQSIHVYKRVKNHLSGKGNGDVYADYRYGKYVYVSIYLCDSTELNCLEKELIARYHATKSYNKTAGGGTYRY